ncbi:MAG: hypothetical protein Q9220_005210 [cf. Caloplaca sp. 1 TL-2023]
MAKRKREDSEGGSEHKKSKTIRTEELQPKANSATGQPQKHADGLKNGISTPKLMEQAKASERQSKKRLRHEGSKTAEHMSREVNRKTDVDITNVNPSSNELKVGNSKDERKKEGKRERKREREREQEQGQKLENNGSVERNRHTEPIQRSKTSKASKSEGKKRERDMAKDDLEPKKQKKKDRMQVPSGSAVTMAPVLPSETSKSEKSKKRHQEKSGKEHRQAREGPTKDTQDAKIHGQSTKTAYQRKDVPLWTISEPVGGQMLDLDPIFSENEEYLLLAYKNSVCVYSTATSLLIRKLPAGRSERVSTFSISTTDSNHLWIGTESGVMQLWDWLEGHLVCSWSTNTPLHALATSKASGPDEALEIVYTISHDEAGAWKIDAHRLKTGAEGDSRETMTLRKSQEPITAFKVLEHGSIIVAISGSVLTLGTIDKTVEFRLDGLSYIWRDIECPEWISCFDVRLVIPNTRSIEKKNNKISQVPRLDIIAGGLKGSLHVYTNLLNQLIERESTSTKHQPTDLNSRTKHWHRNTVLSAKWSRDGKTKLTKPGNYIISGGLETVLLIWQLETGSVNMLPHLGAPIDGIVVSPMGSSYAVRLADNSAMILSTAELKPTFSVAGVQIPAGNSSRHQLPHVPNVDDPFRRGDTQTDIRQQIVSGPSGLLCAVPTATSSRIPTFLPQNASYLQTFDLRSASQLSKQALTRTKATDLNIGPESNTLQEPNVVLMQLSHNGQWLATIDEWMPPERDIAPLTHDNEHTMEARTTRKETYLKFWSWNTDTKTWELVYRIVNPHTSPSGHNGGRNRVLDLVSSPSSNAFATIGDDGIVQVWKASTRQRHGQPVTFKDGKKAVNWQCQSSISLDLATDSSENTRTNARLAYSADGSCIAAAYASSSPWTIHLIDPRTGSVRNGPYGPFEGPVSGLGIIDKYLICLSDQLRTWNLVTQQLVYSYTLNLPNQKYAAVQPLMAVDAMRGTFAVSLPETNTGSVRSRVVIFEGASPTPVFTYSPESQAVIVALTPLNDRPGYIVVNSAAEIRVLTPGTSMALDTSIALPTPPGTPTQTKGLDNVFGPSSKLIQGQDNAAASGLHSSERMIIDDDGEPILDVAEQNARVVPPEKLAAVFETGGGGGHVMPRVGELFEKVAMLYAGNRP